MTFVVSLKLFNYVLLHYDLVEKLYVVPSGKVSKTMQVTRKMGVYKSKKKMHVNSHIQMILYKF